MCQTNDSTKKNTIICDQVLISGGWSPIVNLVSHRGIKPIWNEDNLCFIPGEIKENITVVGSARGIWNLNDCENSGIVGANETLNKLGIHKKEITFPKVGGWVNPIEPLFEVKSKKFPSKSFVDFQHDVTVDDVRLAHREGFISVEHLYKIHLMFHYFEDNTKVFDIGLLQSFLLHDQDSIDALG